MYRCAKCSTVVPPKSAELRLVVETRPIAHPPRKNANPRMKKESRCADCKESEMKHRHLDHPFHSPADDPGGEGWAIVREVRVCRACHDAEVARRDALAAEAAFWDRQKPTLGHRIREVGFSAAVDEALVGRGSAA